MLTDPFGAIVPFHDRLVAVTAAPFCDQVALHPGVVTRWLDGNENPNVHPLTAEAPVLVIVTPAVKPPPPPQFSAE
jgi:hypothetical protein